MNAMLGVIEHSTWSQVFIIDPTCIKRFKDSIGVAYVKRQRVPPSLTLFNDRIKANPLQNPRFRQELMVELKPLDSGRKEVRRSER
ncbi:hypothetical protein OSB04_004096 [Centaurea solstitialis]|uniref:Uncharacterized protein n=1 Tax=Centaurea solstitialis TaxID=347529 RepID=A0AA38WU44_9ASTR|nr:hypothetical protein OSB04_004096 [Centaurea solstitialis]